MVTMEWDVLLDAEFAEWLDGLDERERGEILAHVGLLRERGPQLGRPHVDTVKGSKYSNMKELRVQIAGDPLAGIVCFRPRAFGDLARRWEQARR